MSLNIFKNGDLQKVAGNYKVDNALNSTSTNPVQNKIIAENINALNIDVDTINQTLNEQEQIIEDIKKGKYAMPNLDYKNPLFTFDANNLSYTAIKDCYLVGQLSRKSSTGKTTLSINNIIISTSSVNTSSGEIVTEQLLLKISKDDEVTISGYFEETLYIFDVITD